MGYIITQKKIDKAKEKLTLEVAKSYIEGEPKSFKDLADEIGINYRLISTIIVDEYHLLDLEELKAFSHKGIGKNLEKNNKLRPKRKWSEETREKFLKSVNSKTDEEWKEIAKKQQNTMIEKYGYKSPMDKPNFQEKSKQTKLEKYGDIYYSNEEKRGQTNLEKYGSISPFGNKKIQEKAKKTVQEKYNVDYYMQSKDFKIKAQKTCIKRYGSRNPAISEEIKEKIVQTNLEKYGIPYYCLSNDCINKTVTISKVNRKISQLLRENKIDNELEFHIDTSNYDIHILNTNILLEINPTPYHNITWHPFNKIKSEDYHYNKTKLAKENGYRCIHIWDWDNLDKIINILKPKKILYARKLKVKEIAKQEANEFLDKYHLQERCFGNKVNLALVNKDNIIIELMTFGKPRYNKNYEWELLRLCTKSEYKVVGGTEKLFKYFVIKYKPESILSYCDNSKFNGDVYERLGMERYEDPSPNKHWYNIKEKIHITDNLLRQRGFDQLLGKQYGIFGKGTSNEELMLQHGFVEIYDCGQDRFIWKSTNKEA